MISQWHLTVSCPERKILKFFCKNKKMNNLGKQSKFFFENKDFRVLWNILWKKCLSVKKFQFTISRKPWHGMALYFNCYLQKFSYLQVLYMPPFSWNVTLEELENSWTQWMHWKGKISKTMVLVACRIINLSHQWVSHH